MGIWRGKGNGEERGEEERGREKKEMGGGRGEKAVLGEAEGTGKG